MADMTPEEKLQRLRDGGRIGGSAKVPKGFATMSPERLREIAKKANRASNKKQGKGHDSKQER